MALMLGDDDASLSDIEHQHDGQQLQTDSSTYVDPASFFVSHHNMCQDTRFTGGAVANAGRSDAAAGVLKECSHADAGGKRKQIERDSILQPGWEKGQLIGLIADEIGSMLQAANQEKMASLYPQVPVFGTWPSITGSCTDLERLGVDARDHVELECGVFAPRCFIR